MGVSQGISFGSLSYMYPYQQKYLSLAFASPLVQIQLQVSIEELVCNF